MTVIADERKFYKTFTRLSPRFQGLLHALGEVQLPRTAGFLVSLTDAKNHGVFESVPNRDGYFQVLVGVKGLATDEALMECALASLRRSFQTSGLAVDESTQLVAMVDEWAPRILGPAG